MNTKAISQSSLVLDYSQKWMQGVAQALQEIAGAPVTLTELSPDESQNLFAANASGGLWLRFFAGKCGEQAFLIEPGDAVRLAQTVAHSPLDPEAALAEENREALKGLFQKLAAALPVPGIKAEPEFTGYEPPTWPAGAVASFRLGAEHGPLCVLHQAMSEDFVAALDPSSGSVAAAAPPPAGAALIQDSNLEILMDVDLEVTLRFGQKQMLLRDVLSVGPGSVIELDQQVHEPVELLVGKKVVAWGEVVAVDGNYGLRITAIASPRERLESLAQ